MAANSRTLSPRKNDCGFLLRWGQIISSLTTGAVHERRRDGFLPWWFPGEAFGDGYNFPAGTLINHVICNHPEIHSACHSACHSAALATHISACHHGHGVAKPEPGQNWVWKSDSHRISIYIIYERNVREVSPWDLWVSYQTNPIWIGKLKKWGCLTPNITKLWHGLCRSIRQCQSLQGMCQLLSVEKNSHFGHKEADVTLLHIQRLYVFTQFHKLGHVGHFLAVISPHVRKLWSRSEAPPEVCVESSYMLLSEKGYRDMQRPYSAPPNYFTQENLFSPFRSHLV